MKAVTIAVCLLLGTCSGCASIFCGDHKMISVTSEPPGADFEVTSPSGMVIEAGRTPTNIILKRGRGYFRAGDYIIRFQKDGYEPSERPVTQGFETFWYFVGNFAIGPFSSVVGGLIVDPLTGAMWDIKDVRVKLKPQTITETPKAQRKVTGYEAHISPATGAIETVPIYENKK